METFRSQTNITLTLEENNGVVCARGTVVEERVDKSVEGDVVESHYDQ